MRGDPGARAVPCVTAGAGLGLRLECCSWQDLALRNEIEYDGNFDWRVGLDAMGAGAGAAGPVGPDDGKVGGVHACAR